MGPVALPIHHLFRGIPVEHELQIVSGKVSLDPVHLLVAHWPHQAVSKIVQ